jgi:hypothetical protein
MTSKDDIKGFVSLSSFVHDEDRPGKEKGGIIVQAIKQVLDYLPVDKTLPRSGVLCKKDNKWGRWMWEISGA